MPNTQSAFERVEQLKDTYTNRDQLDPDQIARIEGMYRSLLHFPQDTKTIDVLLFEADQDAAVHLESHIFEVLKTLTWCGEGQINFQRRNEWKLNGENNPNLYLFGPTLRWRGQSVESSTLEKRIRGQIKKRKGESKVVFFYQLEKVFKQPPSLEKCFPINILLVSADQYPEYRYFIAAYLKQLKVRDVIDLGERPEFAGLVNRPAFSIVGTPSKEELLKDTSKYTAEVAFINLMCIQKPLLDELQLHLIQSYMAANPYTFVRATVNEHQAHIITIGEPHPAMSSRLGPKRYRELEEYCESVQSMVQKLQETSHSGLRYFHFLRPDTSLLAKWGNPLALPKPRTGKNPISSSDVETFYYNYATSLVHHFLSGEDLYRLLIEKAHVQSQPSLSYERKLMDIVEPSAAFQTGAPYLTAIENYYRRGLWLDPKTQLLILDTAASFRRFLELASERQPGGNLVIEFNDELCETGTIGAIDKDKRYPKNHNIVVGKPTSHHHAWALYHDWLTTQKEGFAPNFQTPRIRIPITINNLESFVVEGYIIGPTVSELLDMISQQHTNGKYSELRKAIYDVEMERFYFYINNFKELIPSPDRKAEPIDLVDVKQTYIDHFYDAFEHCTRFTNVKYSDKELTCINEVLQEYNWDRLITKDTVRRNLAATFRNSIVQTGLVNISLDELLQLVSENIKISKTKLRNLLFRIDQGDKYCVHWEDMWEMLDFSVGGLSEDEKLHRAQEASSYLSGPPEGSFIFRLYRAVREADLFIIKYGPKIYAKMQRGIYDKGEGTKKLEIYQSRDITHHHSIAVKTCNNLSSDDPIRRNLSGYIERMLSLKRIGYKSILEARR